MAGIQIDGVNNKIDFDDDLDTSISANTDDTLVIEAGGNTMATITATTFTINDGTTITTADNTDTLSLISTDADGSSGPNLRMYRNSGSPADGDDLGVIDFEGRNDASQDVVYAQIKSLVTDQTDGTEDGKLEFYHMLGGSLAPSLQLTTAGIVINESSNDIDFRVESNGNANMLFVDGGNNKVGIGTATPTKALGIGGTGDISLEGSSNAIAFYDSAALKAYITSQSFGDHNGDGLGLVTSGDEPIKFFANGSQRMQIQSNGTIKIGSTPADNVMMFVQHQYGNTGSAGFYHQSPTSSDDTAHYFARSTRAGSSAYQFFNGQSNNGGDTEVVLRGDGQAYADGSWNGGGADYAEYFEWKDGNSSSENRIGYSVVLDGNKIVKATDSDDASKIIGVISANPAIVGDTDIGRWKQKYLRDDYNNFIMEDKKTYEWRETIETKDDNGVVINTENKIHSYYEGGIPDDVTVPADAEVGTQSVKKLNPDWNKDTAYVSREDRKEWDTVGLMGKLRLKKGEPTGTNWIKMRDISDTVEEWLVR